MLSGFITPDIPGHQKFLQKNDRVYQWVKNLMPKDADLLAVYIPSNIDISHNQPIDRYIIIYSVKFKPNGYTTFETLQFAPTWDMFNYSYNSQLNPNSTLILKSTKKKKIGEIYEPLVKRRASVYQILYTTEQNGKITDYSRMVGSTMVSSMGIDPDYAIVLYQNYEGENTYNKMMSTLELLRKNTLYVNNLGPYTDPPKRNIRSVKQKDLDPIETLIRFSHYIFFISFIFMCMRFFACYRMMLPNNNNAFHNGFTILNFLKLLLYPRGKITQLNFLEGFLYLLMLSAAIIMLFSAAFENIPQTYKAVFMIPGVGHILLGAPFICMTIMTVWILPCLIAKRLSDIGVNKSTSTLFLYIFLLFNAVIWLLLPALIILIPSLWMIIPILLVLGLILLIICPSKFLD